MTSIKAAKKTPSRFRMDAMVSLLGTGGGQVVNVLMIPVLSRLYTPKDFGVWALYMAVLIVFSTIVTLRFDVAVVTARTLRLAQDMFLLAVFLSVAGGLLMQAVVSLVEASPLSDYAFIGHQIGWLSWAPLGTVGTAIYALGLSWWMRMRSFSSITAARIGLPLSCCVLQVVLVHMPLGLGLVAGNALGQAGSAALISAAIFRTLPRNVDLKRIAGRSWAGTKRFRNLALYTTPYTLQSQVFRQLTVVILSGLASVQVAGLYAIAQRFIYNPLVLIAAALEQAVYPRLAAAPRDPVIHRLIAAIMMRLAIPLGVGCAIATVFAGPALRFVLGPQWDSGAPYLLATCYATASMVATSWFVRIFDIFHRQRLHLIFDFAGNALIVILFTVALFLSRDPVLAVGVLGAATAIYYAAWAVLAFSISGMDKEPLWRMFALAAAAWAVSLVLCLAASHALGLGRGAHLW